MLAPIAHILPLTTVRRERLLPVSGRVVVRLEQKVAPLDVIAEASIAQRHILIDVARSLKIASQAAQGLIQCKAGDALVKNQVMAQTKGLFPQAVRTPSAGRVILIGGGQVLLQVGETEIELQAGMPGVVTRLIPERGAEITFTGALVQGMWGNGRVDTGLITPLLGETNDALTAKQLDVSQRGSVILSGYCGDPATLQAANELPVRGIILGGISPAILSQAAQVQYPIVVIDGFLRRPLNSTAFKLLTTNAKREVTVNGEAFNRFTGVRPEIFIPLPVTQAPPITRDVESYAPNQPVRLTRDPHAGEVGTLLNLRPGLTVMPSGLRLPAADVKLDSGDQVVVALANLEVLG
jgi:hypothetical protein